MSTPATSPCGDAPVRSFCMYTGHSYLVIVGGVASDPFLVHEARCAASSLPELSTLYLRSTFGLSPAFFDAFFSVGCVLKRIELCDVPDFTADDLEIAIHMFPTIRRWGLTRCDGTNSILRDRATDTQFQSYFRQDYHFEFLDMSPSRVSRDAAATDAVIAAAMFHPPPGANAPVKVYRSKLCVSHGSRDLHVA